MTEQQTIHWTPETENIIKEIHQTILTQLKKRWGEEFASMISLDHEFTGNYGIQFTCKIGEQEEENISEMQQGVITEYFADMAKEPEKYKLDFERMYGASATLLIERAVGKLFQKALPMLLKSSIASEQDNKGIIALGKTIVPIHSVPKDIVFINPETLEEIKKGDSNESARKTTND